MGTLEALLMVIIFILIAIGGYLAKIAKYTFETEHAVTGVHKQIGLVHNRLLYLQKAVLADAKDKKELNEELKKIWDI